MNSINQLILFLVMTLMSFNLKALPLAEKEWTFLLFLNGHNNLSSYGDMNLKDMEKTGSTNQVNLVVEWGKSSDNITRRLLVEKSKDPKKVTSPILMSQKDVDMGDYKNLVNFVSWGVKNFPAKHYFVAVWNHGSGWHLQEMRQGLNNQFDNFNSDLHMNDISFDDNTGNKITTEQLGLAMKEIKSIIGKNIDIYGSDACLMQMMEVAAEMKDSVDFFVGSQDLEPGEGWPYAPFIKKWTAQPKMLPIEVSKLLSKEYLASYSGGVYGTKSVTFSAVDMSQFDRVINSVTQVGAYLRSLDVESFKVIKTLVGATQDFYYSDYKDLGDFYKRLQSTQLKIDKNLISQAQNDLKKFILTSDNSTSFENSTGISIWLPTFKSSEMDRYKGLEFNKLTQWSEFLTELTSSQ